MCDSDGSDLHASDPAVAPVVHHTYDWAVTSIAEAIEETVCSVVTAGDSGVAPLHSVVDPDDLALLVGRETGSSLVVSFEYADYVVSVHATGDVYLYELRVDG